jgi:uncharacterized FlaG/YvyC family protein
MSVQKADLVRIPGRRYHEQYLKEYSDEEVAEMNAEFVEKSVELNRLETEKKEFNDSIKDQMGPIKESLKRLLPILDTKSEVISQEVEYAVNDNLGIIEFIDPNSGEVVGNRKLRSEERLPLLTKISE